MIYEKKAQNARARFIVAVANAKGVARVSQRLRNVNFDWLEYRFFDIAYALMMNENSWKRLGKIL